MANRTVTLDWPATREPANVRFRAVNTDGTGKASTPVLAENLLITEARRVRIDREWVDVDDWSLARAVRSLQARTTYSERDAVSEAVRLDALAASVGNDIATAVDLLEARVEANEGSIESQATSFTELQAQVLERALASAVTALTATVTQQGQSIEANAQELTAVEAAIGERVLGPMPNRFTGADQAAAEAARNAYAMANPDWLAMYDAEDDINVELLWGVVYIYQRRLNMAWVDNGEPLARAAAVSQLNADVAFHEGELIGLARWQVQTSVGDLVGGIGLLNDGTSVRLIVVADSFAIVPAGDSFFNAVVPFVVSGGKVYIDNVLIREASISVAQVENAFLTNLTATHGTLAHARIGQGNIFDLAVGNRIVSDDFTEGDDGEGFLLARNRIVLPATSIRGRIGGASLQIGDQFTVDADGNLIVADVFANNLQNVDIQWEGAIGINSFADFSFNFQGRVDRNVRSYDFLRFIFADTITPGSRLFTVSEIPVTEIPFEFSSNNLISVVVQNEDQGVTDMRIREDPSNDRRIVLRAHIHDRCAELFGIIGITNPVIR